jgi:hypothetical protein
MRYLSWSVSLLDLRFKHDQYFVHYVQKSISEYLNSINYYVTVMHEFCDGCQCQCKNRNCFGNFVESVEEFRVQVF